MKKNFLKIIKTARFITLGEDNLSNIRNIWFCLHGYGQLAPYFARNFLPLEEKGHLVVVPEGLSRFYLNGFSGRVGASWMTREEREIDIEDYIHYLDELYFHILKLFPHNDINIHLLGFSQGAATASRWACMGEARLNSLILWAGLFPQDIKNTGGLERLKNTRNIIVYGSKDEFYEEGKFLSRTGLVEEEGVSYESVTFEGRHEIRKEPLLTVANMVSGK